jgi:4-amino-4-deoxy-L-arabinose transferase-like glycosyltransferase
VNDWQSETQPVPRGFAHLPAATGGAARWFGLLVLVSVGLLAVRWAALQVNATDLFFDESQYWFWAQSPDFGYYSKPPLIAWIIAAATSVCGDSTACIRAPSALLYVIATLGVFAATIQLYGPRVAFLAGVVFATLPGVSLSAGIISTDVPLLAAWAWALAAFIALVRGGGWWTGIALGVAIGVGLNAKYAMAYFVLGIFIFALMVEGQRRLLLDGRVWLAIAVALLLIAPNIVWNLENGFATVAHTADNANWGGRLGRPEKALEFFGAQFGVFGPILFGALLVICWRAWREGVGDAEALLLCFSVPIILIVTTQAFISRAHANWAAVSYVAAAIVVTAVMVRNADWAWLKGSLALHGAVIVALALGTAFAGSFVLPGGADPFARTLGWQALARSIRDERMASDQAAGMPAKAILADTRSLAAQLSYYGRERDVPVLSWRSGAIPKDHFEMTQPYQARPLEPVLFVSTRPERRDEILAAFKSVEEIAQREIAAGLSESRTYTAYRLSGFKPR